MNLFTYPQDWPSVFLMSSQQSKTSIPIPENPQSSDACLIVIYAADDFEHTQVGEKYMLNPKGTYVGNQPDCEVFLKGDSKTPRKALLHYDAEENTWLLKNELEGKPSRAYVNGMVSRLALLENDDNIQVGKQGALFRCLQGKHVRASIYDVLQHRIEEEKKRADTDSLTQVSNRGALDRELKEQVHHCRLYQRSLSAIFLDIDHFKKVNETYGHPGGDVVLACVANRIQEHIRPLDTFARYGGEEFVILLRDANFEQAMVFGERIRAIIENSPALYQEQEIRVTVSIGAATLEADWDEDRLIKEANHCMLQAKKQGRNRVIGYQRKQPK